MSAIFAVSLSGCSDRLGLAYTPPEIPDDLEQYYTPSPNEKAYETLPDGETRFDMHEYYRGSHKCGWNAAIADIRSDRKRQFNSYKDVRMSIQDMKTGCEGYWAGYNEAFRQIENAPKH